MTRPTHFDSIESAYQFVSLLRETLDEAYEEILDDTETAVQAGAVRRIDALRLVDHKLNQLRQHMLASLMLLNDLRMLRRLLMGKPAGQGGAET
jgi:hypothetical protein